MILKVEHNTNKKCDVPLRRPTLVSNSRIPHRIETAQSTQKPIAKTNKKFSFHLKISSQRRTKIKVVHRNAEVFDAVTWCHGLFTLGKLRVGLEGSSRIIKNTLKFTCLVFQDLGSQLDLTLDFPPRRVYTFLYSSGPSFISSIL